MITKGIITTIDYSNNLCKVRIPLFETANTSDEVILPAIFLTQPGIYNGYNEGDIVFVGFEGSGLDCPIVLGKLFLGASKESENSKKGSIEASNLVVDSTATLPLTTKLTFKDTSKTQVQVANRYSNYKSLLDIIDAINNTEENITVANKNFMNSTNSVVSKVVTEYLSQAETLDTPTKENPSWSTSMPDLTDGFDIWQKTTCYNHRWEILGEPEILCLTGVVASFVYTLSTSSKVHTGTAQTEKIVVEAKVKIGTQTETLDANAILKYSWSDNEWKESSNKNKFEITDCLDKDLIIKAYHQTGIDADNEPIYTEYATETITFIAQNTPTLDLSRDNASIAYDSFGEDKINLDDKVSTTATLYFNGQVVEDAEYTWNYNSALCDATVNDNTITVDDLDDSVETVELTCSTTYNGVSLSKIFTVTKVLQGKSPYKIDIVNEFVSIITESDGIIPEEYSWDTNTLHTINIYYGDKLEERKIAVGTDTPTSGSDLYLKYTVTGLTAEELTSISASFTNKASALGNDVDRGEIKYELYEGTVLVASEKFELVRIKCGEAAMHYTGKTSTNTIKRDSAGNLTPETVTIWLDKTVGHDTNTVNTTDYKLYYSKTKEDSLTLLEASESKGISINNNKWTIDTNKLGIQGQLSLDFRVTLGDSSDFITISMMDIPVVNDGESVDVEYAYWWSDNYYNADNKMWDLEAPTSVLAQETAAAETWFKPSNEPSIEATYYKNNNCKIIFVSRRMGIASDIDSALWSKPELFAVANSEAYKILSTAEGLFGYGQGLYYTFQVPESPTASQQALFTTTSDGKKQITINKIPSSAGSYNCVEGTKITATQEEIAYWISEDPTVRKELIKVYIDAEYIKTGAFTVKNGNDILFQAGLDKDNDNEPVVKIAGFDVSPSRMVNIVDEPVIENGITKYSGVGIAPESGHGCWALWAGPQSGDGKETPAGKPYGHDAPFKVGHGGELYTSNISATGGNIGGFDINSNSLSKTVTKSNETGSETETGKVQLSTEKISLGANGECTIDASGNISAANVTINEATIGEWNINSSTVNGAKINTIGTSKIRLESSNEDGGTLFLQGKNNSSFNITIQDGLAATAAQEAITNARLETDANGLSIITSAENAGFRIASPSGTEKTTYIIKATMVKNSGRISISSNIGLNDKTVVPVTLYLAAVNIWGTWSFSSVRYNLTKSTSSDSLGISWTKSLGTTKWDYISSSQNNKIASNEAKITVPILNSATGTNYSYGKLVPAVAGLTLGTAEAPWDTIYVKNIVALNTSTSGISQEIDAFKYNDGMSDGQTEPISRDQNGNATGTGIVSGKPSVGCFEAGTQISMADGTYKNIEDVQIGDQIYSYNILTKKVEIDTVKQTYSIVQPTDCVILTFADGSTLWTTRTHPFYTTSGWVSLMPYYNYTPKEYKELTEELFEMMTVGQKFYKLTKSGKTKLVKLSRIQYRHGLHKEHKVYNLDVSTNHTFFTNGILGHNAISPSISKLGGTSGGII